MENDSTANTNAEKAWCNIWAWAVSEVINRPPPIILPPVSSPLGKAVYYGPKSLPLCGNNNTGKIVAADTISGFYLLGWETSVDNGNSWKPVASSSYEYTFTNASNNQQYRFLTGTDTARSTSCRTYFSAPVTITVNPVIKDSLYREICEGQNYLDHDTSGVYTDTSNLAGKCSISILTLVVKKKSHASLNQSICEGQTYMDHSTTGTYTHILTNANGCDSIITVNLTVKSKSFNTIDRSVCAGQTYEGHNTSGTYIDTFAAANGCDSIRTLHLTVKPKLVYTINQSVCEGQTYEGYNTTGTYIDTFASSNGCDSIRTLHLTVLKKPFPDLGLNKELCKGDTLVLNPGVFSSYLWQDSSTSDHFIVRNAGVYSVKVTNFCGTNSDETLISEKICNIYFPNAFTPNNDGKNDVFKILNAYLLQDYYLAVYNRWGQKVFETKDYTKGWDGLLNGKSQSTGVYIWFCRYKKNNVVTTAKGTIVLIR